MTEIAFHFNAPDKVGYACRLLRKAFGSGAKVVVSGDSALLGELDLALWTFGQLEFVPHCREPGAAPAVLAASPIVLTGAPRTAPHHQVLVNLGGPVPDGFETFDRLIEVVTCGDEDRAQARQRWKHYSTRGYSMSRHDLAAEAQR